MGAKAWISKVRHLVMRWWFADIHGLRANSQHYIPKRKKVIPTNIYCTLDTETVGGATKPKGIYHLGGIIHNRKGEVVGCFNYLVKEWLDEIAFDEYAKKNIGLYLAMLAEGTATLIDTEDHAIEMVNALFDCCGV